MLSEGNSFLSVSFLLLSGHLSPAAPPSFQSPASHWRCTEGKQVTMLLKTVLSLTVRSWGSPFNQARDFVKFILVTEKFVASFQCSAVSLVGFHLCVFFGDGISTNVQKQAVFNILSQCFPSVLESVNCHLNEDRARSDFHLAPYHKHSKRFYVIQSHCLKTLQVHGTQQENQFSGGPTGSCSQGCTESVL